MAPQKTDKDRDMARRLRVDGKKTLREIASLTGISIGLLSRWSKAEGWPDPNKERRELREILTNKPEEQTEGKKPEKKWLPPLGTQAQKKVELPENLPEIDYDQDLEALSKQLFKWAAKVAQSSAEFSMSTVLKLLEVSSRMAVATHTPKVGEARRLTIMVPGEIESYRDADDG